MTTVVDLDDLYRIAEMKAAGELSDAEAAQMVEDVSYEAEAPR